MPLHWTRIRTQAFIRSDALGLWALFHEVRRRDHDHVDQSLALLVVGASSEVIGRSLAQIGCQCYGSQVVGCAYVREYYVDG